MNRFRLCSRVLASRLAPALAVCLLVAPERADAQGAATADDPPDPVLRALIEQSLAARPELAGARADLAAERERAPQLSALPDPMVQVGVQNDGFTSWQIGKMETSFYQVMLSQTLPWPGKRALRREGALLGIDQAAQTVARVRLSTEAEVRRGYVSLLLARERLALLERLEGVWQKSAAVARVRYETGQGAQSDLLRAQLEVNRLRQRRVAMQGDETNEQQTLNRLRSAPLDTIIATTVFLRELPLPPRLAADQTVADALVRSPELASARLAMGRADNAVELARRAYLPDVTINVGVMPRGGPFPPMWSASVAVPMPLFSGDRQSHAHVESQAHATSASKRVEALRDLIVLRTHQRQNALGTMLETVRLYREGLLVQSQATAESTLSQYQVGKVTFASVLEANAGLIADQDGYLQALALAQKLEIDRAEINLAPTSLVSAPMAGSSVPGAGTMGVGDVSTTAAGGTSVEPVSSGM